jgi:hypothetical protein
MKDHLSEQLSSTELALVTGGGWKGKAVSWGWEALKWTGIPTVIGGGAAWVERKIRGPQPPPQPAPEAPKPGT